MVIKKLNSIIDDNRVIKVVDNIKNLRAFVKNNTVLLTWEAPKDLIDYIEIYYGVETPNERFEGYAKPKGTIIKDLEYGNIYTFVVKSKDLEGHVSSSEIVTSVNKFPHYVKSWKTKSASRNISLIVTKKSPILIDKLRKSQCYEEDDYKYFEMKNIKSLDINKFMLSISHLPEHKKKNRIKSNCIADFDYGYNCDSKYLFKDESNNLTFGTM